MDVFQTERGVLHFLRRNLPIMFAIILSSSVSLKAQTTVAYRYVGPPFDIAYCTLLVGPPSFPDDPFVPTCVAGNVTALATFHVPSQGFALFGTNEQGGGPFGDFSITASSLGLTLTWSSTASSSTLHCFDCGFFISGTAFETIPSSFIPSFQFLNIAQNEAIGSNPFFDHGGDDAENDTVVPHIAGASNGTGTWTLVSVQTGTTPPLQITTTSLPNADTGQPYSSGTIQATGGSDSGYTWSVSSGSLPGGFTLSPEGSCGNSCTQVALSSTGSPAAPAGSYPFTVQVMDSAGNLATQALTLSIRGGPGSITLLDPVPVLLNGAAVTSAANLPGLVSRAAVVKGAAADGVTELVLQVNGANPNEHLALSIDSDGGLSPVGAAGFASSTTIQADSSGSAFALYRAPTDYAQSDADPNSLLPSRTVNVTLQSLDDSSFTAITPITILRPPLILIHGLWDSSIAWTNFRTNFTLLGSPSSFFIRAVDYDQLLTGITATSPAYNSHTQLPLARANSMGFDFNATNILQQINLFITDFKTANNAAAVKADIVAHSMGGDVMRSLRENVPSFANTINFDLGVVHKLITIGTPHLGSPLATQLLQANNDCVANLLAAQGNIAFSTVTFSGKTYTGGAADLEGNGSGSGLSPALMSLQKSFSIPFPTALIAGSMSSTNLAGTSCILCIAQVIRSLCGNAPPLFSNDPLATGLTPAGWPTLLGGASDATVPVNSQLNNRAPTSIGMQINGVVHSSAMVDYLDFVGPAELDDGLTASQVLLLLNESQTGPDFQSL
jgi:pimeloyl-ACP methyl ester carboxylesterase